MKVTYASAIIRLELEAIVTGAAVAADGVETRLLASVRVAAGALVHVCNAYTHTVSFIHQLNRSSGSRPRGLFETPVPTRLASRSRVARQAGAGVGPHAAPAVLASFAAYRCVIKAERNTLLIFHAGNVPRQTLGALSRAKNPETRFLFICYREIKIGIY